jgi:DNA-directed RNA polymerase specialized sigma24 family protein
MSISVSGLNISTESNTNDEQVHPGLIADTHKDLFELAMRFLPHYAQQVAREDAASEIVLKAVVAANKKGESPVPFVIFTAKVAGKRIAFENQPLQPTKKNLQGHSAESLDEILEIAGDSSSDKKISFGFAASLASEEAGYAAVEMEEFISHQAPVQKEILALKMQGYSNNEVAMKLGMTAPSVNYHLNKLHSMYKNAEAA